MANAIRNPNRCSSAAEFITAWQHIGGLIFEGPSAGLAAEEKARIFPGLLQNELQTWFYFPLYVSGEPMPVQYSHPFLQA